MQAGEVKGSPKLDRNGDNDEKVWEEPRTLRKETKRKLDKIKNSESDSASRLKAIHGYKVPGWDEIWEDCNELIEERDIEYISEILEDLQNLNEELTPIAALFESRSELKTTSSSQRDEKSTAKKSRQKTRRVSTLQIHQQAPNRIKLADDESKLPQEQIELYKSAQNTVCDQYRKDAKYGDGSSAFMVLIEQVAGGVGGEPKSIVGNTLHKAKCQEAIGGLTNKLGRGLPQKIEDRIQREITKMQEGIDWADKYCTGNEPKLPRWAQPHKYQIDKFKKDMD